MTRWYRAIAALALVAVPAASASRGQAPVPEPGLTALVEQFFATQEAEDADAYLALWSDTAARPARAMLAFVFASGNDRFSDVAITRVTGSGPVRRLRVVAQRQREATTRDGRVLGLQRTSMAIALGVVSEGGSWRLTSEGPAADELAAALLAAATPEARAEAVDADRELVGPAVVEALGRRGAEAAQTQRYAEAASAFARAREMAVLIGDPRAEGEALQNLANARYFLRDFDGSLEAYDSRLAIERQRADPVGIAAALVGVATIHYARAEYGQALAAYTEALAVQERLQDDSGMARTLVSVGNVRYLRGDYAAAIADYRRGRALAVADAGLASDALAGEGRTLLAQGDFAAALAVFEAVLAGARAGGSHAAQGVALSSLGDIHVRLGNLAQARASFEAARDAFSAANDAGSVGRAWQGLAVVALIGGRPSEAEQHYARSREICGAARDAECAAGAVAGLAFAQLTQRHFAAAADSYQAAIAVFAGLNRPQLAARAEVGLSQALTGGDLTDAALAAAGRARDAVVGDEMDDVLWRALVAESRARQARGETNAALSTARAAVTVVERMRAAAATRPGTPLPLDTASAYTALAALLAGAGEAAATFDVIEQVHAHELRSRIVAHEREIAPGTTADERTAERDAAAAVVTLRARIARERELPIPDRARIEALAGALDRAVALRTSQRDALYRRLPFLPLWRGEVEPATAADVGVEVDDGTLAVHLLVDAEALVAVWAWPQDGAVALATGARRLPRGDLAEQVARLQQPAVLQDPVAWRNEAGRFVALLPDGLGVRLRRASRVLLVPHDILWRIPFEALPQGDGYLADAAGIAYATSLAARLRVPDVERPAPAALLAIAPSLDDAVRQAIGRIAPGWTLAESDTLDHEAAAATGNTGLRPLSGVAATEAAVRAGAAAAGALHFAAPFRLSAASPLFSPILLAAPAPVSVSADRGPSSPIPDPVRQPGDVAPTAGASADDGRLDLREVFSLQAEASLVVLSDGAALSMAESAAALPVLDWAWRAATVRSLVLPRWGTDPEMTETFVSALHAAVRDGADPGTAVRAARQAVRARKGGAAPYFWAGWIAIGGS